LNAIDVKDERFKITAQKLIDPETGIWTDYGLRSLSSKDPFYRLADNYWTSPIWMNINFLIVSAFHGFTKNGQIELDLKEEVTDAYHSLRKNLINTIVS
jgi:mannosyl-oligosaccharide glucosidase